MDARPARPNSEAFKLSLVGSKGVGKYNNYWDSNLTNIYRLELDTNFGQIKFDIFDSDHPPGAEHTTLADCGIIMYDVGSSLYPGILAQFPKAPLRLTIPSTGEIHGGAIDIPIVACGNKVDIENRDVKYEHASFFKEIPHFDISALANYNIEVVFTWLARKVTGQQSLVLSHSFLRDPILTVDKARLDNEKEVADATWDGSRVRGFSGAQLLAGLGAAAAATQELAERNRWQVFDDSDYSNSSV